MLYALEDMKQGDPVKLLEIWENKQDLLTTYLCNPEYSNQWWSFTGTECNIQISSALLLLKLELITFVKCHASLIQICLIS
ncbi:hypothetical protein L1987_32572 [Smallanthus sonchifolius]|uniref:Uncharacterized protein n=1 Tax=Smallanthus sonchifolius TaxID=185202 RepID=A0ACB9HPA0_9ASTR|nr:hypothetical protein L1987_32572 [Smallanthus sonchifolius]